MSNCRWFTKYKDKTIHYVLPKWYYRAPNYFQKNFVLASAIAKYVTENINLFQLRPLDLDNFSNNDTLWPYSLFGRFQKLKIYSPVKSHQLILDVCHNPSSVAEFISTLEKDRIVIRGKKKIPIIFTVLKNKNGREMIKLLHEAFDPIMIFKLDNERSWQESDLGTSLSGLEVYDNFSALWAKRASHFDGLVAICGSFFAVGNVLEFFKISLESLNRPSYFNTINSFR